MPKKERLPTFDTPGATYSSRGVEGEGATSFIHKVVDEDGNEWALKCLKPERATSSQTKRFLNELNFCRNSSHPNVIRVVDHGFVVEGGQKCPFYVMQLYPSTLRKLIQAGAPIPDPLRRFSQLLDGVEAAHIQGVRHRDLKPENVLYDPVSGHLVVSDFGIAHFTAETMYTAVETQAADRLANFQYAAPEQRMRSGTVDHRADIYALGLILNEIFTGHAPHGAGHPQIGEVTPECGYLDEIVDQMRQQSPERRPGSIDEVKRTLIARGNEFVARQKLDTLRQTVVPAATVTDPVIISPMAVDIEGNTLVVSLGQRVPPQWIRSFNSIGGYSYFPGAGPSDWRFEGDKARLTPPDHMLETYAQQLVNNFKDYVIKANASYQQVRERETREREDDEKTKLQEAISQEERRVRILRGLKV